MDLIIDQELKDFLPPSPTSDADLEAQLVAEGVQRKIVVWKGRNVIVDGHRRHAIASRRGLPFEVQEINFPDKLTVMEWMVKNQLAPRNLSATQEAQVRAKLAEAKEAAKTRHGRGTGNVAQQVASELDVSERTVYRSKKLAAALEAIPAELRTAIEAKSIKASQEDIVELAELPEEHHAQVVAEIQSGQYKSLGEVLHGVEDPAPAKKPPKKAASPADTAKSQVKTWADTIGRWLGQSPSIDELRSKWPGPQGDVVVQRATELYEALKNWQKAIK